MTGFSLITTEELRVAVNSSPYDFDCVRADILCEVCPFDGNDCYGNDIDQAMGRLARAELKRREEEC